MEALKDTFSVSYETHSETVCGLGVCYLALLPEVPAPVCF